MEKLVIFDCDGTLVDSEVIASKVYPKYWKTHGVFVTENDFKKNFIGTGKNAPIVVDTYSKMPSYAEKVAEALVEKELWELLSPVDGIHDLLANLGADLCVASNSSLNYIKKALSKTNIEKFFGDKVFSSELVPNPKPAPDLFLYIATKLGYKLDNCIVIEDSIFGVTAAQRSGIKVVGFSGGGHFIPELEEKLKNSNPDWYCSSSKELAVLLKSIT